MMDMRPLGRTDIQVSACCLGTMTWGEQNTEAEGHEQMDYAVSQGVNFFDTAELYSIPPKPETNGRTEEIIGTWMKARNNRGQIVLASKVVGRSPMTWHRSMDTELCRLTKAHIDDAVTKSLKRLQTDYIDLYQLHWPDRPAPIFGSRMSLDDYDVAYEAFEDILSHLDAHVKAGRIRHVGLSNETPWGVMRFIAESNARGLPRMVSIQNAYSLVNRKFEEGLDEIALREQVGLLAYSPLAQGYLTGKYRGGVTPPGSRKALFERLGRYEKPGADEAITAYLDLAAERGLDPAQMALRFCDTRPFMTSTIIGATTMDQLRTNIAAFSLPWDRDLERAIHEIHNRNPSPCP